MPATVTEGLRFEPEPTKGSRFIATVIPVGDEDQCRTHLGLLRAEMPDASHHCWAWRLASPAIERAGDDGEPSGSAGRPILAALTGRDLVDTAVVVARYFGGTKLGVGGLVRAYGGAAAAALDRALTAPWLATVGVVVVHEHGDTEPVQRAIVRCGANEVEVVYGQRVTRYLEVAEAQRAAFSSAIADATSGRADVR